MEVLIGVLFLLVCILSYQNLLYRRELSEFSRFLEKAENGQDLVSDYNEKEVSKLKSSLIKFLRANQVKNTKILQEQKKIHGLISDISHQIKTPISNLLLYTDLLEKEYKEEYVSVLDFEIHKLDFLMQDLIQSSRMESGLIQLSPEETSLNKIIQELLEELKSSMENKDLHLIFNDKNAVVLPLDYKWTREAIHNLLENAIKYSPKGSTINLSLYKSQINYNLDISNSSAPLLEEERAQIFQRFYRGRNSSGKDGFGLGLFITREIIQRQGGRIQVSYREGRIKFSIDFPI